MKPLYKKYFPKIVKDLDKKMMKGYLEYSDKSFAKDPIELCQELIEEVEDVMGWGMILKIRLEEVKKQLKKL